MTGMFDTVDRRLSGGEDADRAREIWKIMGEAFDKGGEARGPRISGRATIRGICQNSGLDHHCDVLEGEKSIHSLSEGGYN